MIRIIWTSKGRAWFYLWNFQKPTHKLHTLHCSVQWLETRTESDFKTMQRTKQFFKAPHYISTTNITRWPKMSEVVSSTMYCIHINVSSVVEFYRWWVLKCKIFAQELTCSKEIVLKQSCNELWFIKKWF